MIVTRRSLGLGTLAVLTAGPALAAPPALDEIVRRHTQARGGAGALDAVRDLRAEMEIEEQGVALSAIYTASASGRMRIDIFTFGSRVWSEGLDAAGAWAWQSGKPAAAPESPQGAAALRHGIEFNLFGLHRYAERGHRLSLDGRETIGGVDYHVIRIDMTDGFTTWRFVNPTTWMIDRGRDVRAFHPDADPQEKRIESVFEDWRPVSGVMTAFRTRSLEGASGKGLGTSQIKALRFNTGAPEAIYDRNYKPT